MATVNKAAYNPYSNTVTGGTIPGDAADGHVIRYIDEFVDALEARDYPFLTEFGMGSEFDQMKLEWGQRRTLADRVDLNTSMDNSQTTLVLNSGQGMYVQQYSLLRIIDPTNGDEIVWVSAPEGSWGGPDSLSGVIRAQGGTSAVAHTAPLTIEIIGIAEPMVVDHASGNYIYGDFDYNHPQRFGTKLTADNLARVTPNHEVKGDQLLEGIRQLSEQLKLYLEKAVIYGRRQAGTPNPSAKRPSLMGGITQYLTSNVYNQSAQKLTYAAIDNAHRDVFSKVGVKVATDLWGNENTLAIVDRIAEPLRFTAVGPTTNEFDFTVTKLRLRTGTVNFKLNRNMPDGELWGLYGPGIKVRPYKGKKWAIRDLATKGDYSERAIVGTYSLSVKEELRMFRIHNFVTDITQYNFGA